MASAIAAWKTARDFGANGRFDISGVIGAPIGYAVHEQQTRIAVEAERDKLDDAAKVAFASLNGTVRMLAENLPITLHPGAERYYREAGVLK